MYKYIFKRLLMIIPVLLLALLVVYFIVDLTPGDPARNILGKNASNEAVEQLRDELGLDKPLLVRYARYIKDILRGNFGKSYRTGSSVSEDVLLRYPVTIKLAFGCSLWTIIVGVTLGILAAIKQYSLADNIFSGFALLLASVPEFWFGMMAMLIFSIKLDIFPVTGADSWKHFILPIITLSTGSIAIVLRMTRSSMLEVIRQDYIRTAKAKGVDAKLIIREHALPNALLPIVTELGSDLAGLLCGTIFIETVFGMAGIGTYLLAGVRSKDIPVVMASTVIITLTSGIINLIVDISYAYIDPRIKADYE